MYICVWVCIHFIARGHKNVLGEYLGELLEVKLWICMIILSNTLIISKYGFQVALANP